MEDSSRCTTWCWQLQSILQIARRDGQGRLFTRASAWRALLGRGVLDCNDDSIAANSSLVSAAITARRPDCRQCRHHAADGGRSLVPLHQHPSVESHQSRAIYSTGRTWRSVELGHSGVAAVCFVRSAADGRVTCTAINEAVELLNQPTDNRPRGGALVSLDIWTSASPMTPNHRSRATLDPLSHGAAVGRMCDRVRLLGSANEVQPCHLRGFP